MEETKSTALSNTIAGRSKLSVMRKGSPKESEAFTDSGSELNEEEATIDPKIMEMFENVR